MFQDEAGVFDGHFAGQQRRHRLDGGRVTGGLFQAERGVGGRAPFAAAFAVAARALDRDGAKAGVEGAGMTGGAPGEFFLADRAERRGGVGLGLRPALHALTEQGLDVARRLVFEMSQVLSARQNEAVQGLFQPRGRAGGQHGQGFGDGGGEWLRGFRFRAGGFHAHSLHRPALQ